MTVAHLATTAWAWSRPRSLWPLAVALLYVLYFATDAGQDSATSSGLLLWLLATATSAFWIGQCIREACAWTPAVLVPGYRYRLARVGTISVALSVLLSCSAALATNLDVASSLPLAALTTTASLLAGLLFREAASATFLSILAALLPAAFAAGRTAIPAALGHPITSLMALAATAALAACFWIRAQALVADPSQWRQGSEQADRPLSIARAAQVVRRFGQRSSVRIALLFSVGAVLVVALSAHLAALNDVVWIYVVALLVCTLAMGRSTASPRGKLAEATTLLLFGAAKTRSAIGRRIIWRVLVHSLLGGGVFVAVTWALTNEVRLAEILAALAACHVYMTIASGSPWLLSSRGSVLVAMPFVVLVTWFGSQLLSTTWPAAVAAFLASAAVAICWGGKRIGRLDFIA